MQFSPKDNAEDSRVLLCRLHGFPTQVDQIIDAFKVSIARKLTLPPSFIDAMITQFESIYEGKTLAESPFAGTSNFVSDDGGIFAIPAERVVTEDVFPAFASCPQHGQQRVLSDGTGAQPSTRAPCSISRASLTARQIQCTHESQRDRED